ncbi:MAG: hypothetical protein NT027_13880 [Proteobacteria bacterium]|nr:hypothetical protein [Pseudomonadota bacterium]
MGNRIPQCKVVFDLKVILNSQLEYFGANGKFFGSDQMGKLIEVTKPTVDDCSVFSELGYGVDDCPHRRYSYSMRVDPESKGIIVTATEIERDGKRLVFLKCDPEIPLDQWGIDLTFKIGHITKHSQDNCVLAP